MDTKKLRQKILDLAIHGKLVPQDPNDEPASVLLERIRKEKEQLIKEGKIKAPKKSKTAGDTSHYPKKGPWELPDGWAWCNLKDVCHIAGRIGFRGYTKADLVKSDGAITLSPSNIINDGTDYSHCTYISWAKYEESPEIMVEIGDVLLVKTGSSYGKAALVTTLPRPATINPQLVVLKNIRIDHRFLTFVLQSAYVRKRYEAFVLGTAIPTFTQEALGNMLIPLPPIEAQRRIANQIEGYYQIGSSIDSSRRYIEDAILSAKARILDLAIHGKLVPQDPSDEPAIELLKRINPAFQPSDNLHYEGILPSGWTICCLEDVLDYEQPQAYIVNSTDYSDDYRTPVLTPGKSFVLGYTNELSGICNLLPVIIFDDFTTESKYVDFPFKVKSSAMKILRARGEINLKYVAIFMSITRLVGDTHKRYWISEYSKIPIPIPPLREQGRIVLAAKHLLNQLDNLIACISDN